MIKIKYLFFFFLPVYLMADSNYDGRLYFTDKTEMIMSWDSVTTPVPAQYYKIKENHYDVNKDYDLGIITTTSYVIKKRRCGHFRYYVKACRVDTNNNELCSEWADSLNIDTASVDGVKGRWLVYWRLAPITNPHIE